MSLKKQPGVSLDPVIIFVCSPEWGLLGCLDSFIFDLRYMLSLWQTVFVFNLLTTVVSLFHILKIYYNK